MTDDSNASELKIIDLSKITDIDEQKQICDEMFNILLEEEKILKNQFTSIQTIYDIIESDKILKLNLSEIVGYTCGSINSSITLFNSGISNLQEVISGNLDDLDTSALGMYITIWYNIAVENAEIVKIGCEELTKIESQVISKILDDDTDDAIVLRGSIH